MFKKILLVAVVLSSELIQTKQPEDFIGATVVGVAAGLGIFYWQNREPNEIKRLRALELCEMYEKKLHTVLASIKEPKDVVHFISQSSDVHDERKKLVNSIARSNREMEDRYAHPLKPWNWSDDMKDMFNRIQGVHAAVQTVTIMYRYQSLFDVLLHNTKPNVKQEAILDDVLDLEKIKSPYPVIVCADKIAKDIEALIAARDRASVEDGRCAYVVIGMLREAYNSITQSDEYAEEMRHQKELSLKKIQRVVSEVDAKVKSAQNLAQQRYKDAQLRQEIEIFRKKRAEMQQRRKLEELERANVAAQMPCTKESLVPVGDNSQ